MSENLLSRKFYERNIEKVARELLGKNLIKREKSTPVLSGKIVETEAYFGEEDPASRASSKKTKINRIMWGRGGLSLVYMVHGNWLFNVVTEGKEIPGAVLIRALEPLEGLETMGKRRGKEKITELASGPGKLTQALGISKEHHGLDLTSSEEIFIEESSHEVGDSEIGTSNRIGVSEDLSRELRFFVKESNHVSC